MATGRVVVFASTRNNASAMSSNDRISAKSTPAMIPGLDQRKNDEPKGAPPRRAQREGRFLKGGINLRKTGEHCADRIGQDEQDVRGYETNRRLTDVGRDECDQQSNADHDPRHRQRREEQHLYEPFSAKLAPPDAKSSSRSQRCRNHCRGDRQPGARHRLLVRNCLL